MEIFTGYQPPPGVCFVRVLGSTIRAECGKVSPIKWTKKKHLTSCEKCVRELEKETMTMESKETYRRFENEQ